MPEIQHEGIISFYKEHGLDQSVIDYIIKHDLWTSADPVFGMLEHYYYDQKYSLNQLTFTDDLINTYQPIAEFCSIMDANAFLSMKMVMNKKEYPWFYMYLPVAMSLLNATPNIEMNTLFLNNENKYGDLNNTIITEVTSKEKEAFSKLLPFTKFLGLSDEDGFIWLKKYIFKCGGYTGWPGEASFIKQIVKENE